jgi:hypothetical protein
MKSEKGTEWGKRDQNRVIWKSWLLGEEEGKH